jgi:site-specific recombinase XerD
MKRAAHELGPNPWAITAAELVAWIGAYQGAPSSRKGLRDTVRSFYLWAAAAGFVDVSPAATLPSVPVPVGIPRPAPASAVLAAIGAADDRTRLAICLGMYAGLRRMEISKVHTSDVRGSSLYVVGKGGKHREVPIHPLLAEELTATVRRLGVPGMRYEGWLFPSARGGHLSPSTIGNLVRQVLPDAWTTHTLRHRFASQAYAHGGRDLRAVQELLGHSKPETTARYTAVPDGALAAAVAGVGL